MSATLIFTAIASGAFIGAVLGLIGAGGAMISVPILLYLFDFSPLHATTTAGLIESAGAEPADLTSTLPRVRCVKNAAAI